MSEEITTCNCFAGSRNRCILPLERYSKGYRMCCDSNGCKCYHNNLRNPFWPEFAHPRWLSCSDLYRDNCVESCEESC